MIKHTIELDSAIQDQRQRSAIKELIVEVNQFFMPDLERYLERVAAAGGSERPPVKRVSYSVSKHRGKKDAFICILTLHGEKDIVTSDRFELVPDGRGFKLDTQEEGETLKQAVEIIFFGLMLLA